MSSSHVVVLDSTARRAVIRVTPLKHLSDVLQEACNRFGVDPSQHGLKHNNKSVDISRTMRLSGLSTGAKLELVLLSRSPSVVSVALQLPESEAKDVPNARLVDKFPSTTTLWLVLRKFESGAGGGKSFNFTGRGAPRVQGEQSGAGRLFYETPVLQVMGRELSSFTELQKTLGQLGFNSGSALLRMGFRVTESPLEEAMAEISQYFTTVEGNKSTEAGAHAGGVTQNETVPETEAPSISDDIANLKSPSPIGTARDEGAPVENGDVLKDGSSLQSQHEMEKASEVGDSTITGPDQRPISVFAPPANNTPKAAQHAFNEADYVPTISHAQTHQSRLSSHARNIRLLSDAELAAQQEASQQQINTASVNLKVRYPDQSTVIAPFTAQDTSETLYSFVRDTLREDLAAEPFTLHLPGSGIQGRTVIRDADRERDVPRKLIAGYGLTGRVLVNVVWGDAASDRIRKVGSEGVLKSAFRVKAQEIDVPDMGSAPTPSGNMEGRTMGDEEKDDAKGKEKGERKPGQMPKWLKLPGKK
ncbi:MAG: hypothetical protein M4579_006870 [Chaenotheca gracillima]|nr:MAG: hypothetical protein M4579_006870 [Chaenotheca gracillima]